MITEKFNIRHLMIDFHQFGWPPRKLAELCVDDKMWLCTNIGEIIRWIIDPRFKAIGTFSNTFHVTAAAFIEIVDNALVAYIFCNELSDAMRNEMSDEISDRELK